MKNKSTGIGETRKKGFYVALSAGVGAVLVLALVISFSNLTTISPNPQQYAHEAEDAAYNQDAVLAGVDTTMPYLAQAEEQALFRPRSTPPPDDPAAPPSTPEPTQPGTSGPPAAADTPAGTQERRGPQAAPDSEPAAPDQSAVPDYPEAPDLLAAPDLPAAAENVPTETAPDRPATPEPASEQASFAPFTEYDQLIWPVYGEIAMIFSQDRLIYNPTLDQWRTNDDLRISAPEGTPVRAAAAGHVTEVGNDRVYGNFVRIDNGNGWETIHGQLMDGILVVEGDVVQAGQVIGGVGRPSVFSVLNGHHVSLRVLHDDNLIDPQLLLADILE